MNNLSTVESPQTPVASTEFDCPKATLELSPDHCSSERSFVLNQPFSEIKTGNNYCAHGCNVIGAFVSRPQFNVLCLRITRSLETTVQAIHTLTQLIPDIYKLYLILCYASTQHILATYKLSQAFSRVDYRSTTSLVEPPLYIHRAVQTSAILVQPFYKPCHPF